MRYESAYNSPPTIKKNLFYTKKEFNVLRLLKIKIFRISLLFLLIIIILCSLLLYYVLLSNNNENSLQEWVVLNANNHKIK